VAAIPQPFWTAFAARGRETAFLLRGLTTAMHIDDAPPDA
jgi:hypothetical protein